MYIITGASDNHYFTLINMINSFINNTTNIGLIVYNLGINNNRWIQMQEMFKNNTIIFRIFDYSKYPDWFNIEQTSGRFERGAWAWKSAALYEIYLEKIDDIIVWMDAGNLITDNLNNLNNFLIKNGIFSGVSSGSIAQWTHPSTIQALNCSWVNCMNRNAACIGINTSIDYALDFLNEWHEKCMDKDCIAPEGSGRHNHRQDQAVFTILFYKYKMKYNFDEYINTYLNILLGFTIHNDFGDSDNPH